MPSERRSSTARGLGYGHRKLRDALLAGLRPGQPCELCGQGMFPGESLDLDHVTPRVEGGQGPRRLTHSRCNRRAGGRLGQQRRRLRWVPAEPPRCSRDW